MKHALLLIVLFGLLVGSPVLAQDVEAELSADITNAAGESIGTLSIIPMTANNATDMALPMEVLESSVGVWIQVQGLTPGFHGMHIHSVGSCDPSGDRPFTSAGGHLHAEGQTHGQHVGDLPSLLVTEQGFALLAFTTDRFTLDDLMDEDGSAVIIHANADNFGNIPGDRYAPSADETTLNTGDAGGRTACGIISRNS